MVHNTGISDVVVNSSYCRVCVCGNRNQRYTYRTDFHQKYGDITAHTVSVWISGVYFQSAILPRTLHHPLPQQWRPSDSWPDQFALNQCLILTCLTCLISGMIPRFHEYSYIRAHWKLNKFNQWNCVVIIEVILYEMTFYEQIMVKLTGTQRVVMLLTNILILHFHGYMKWNQNNALPLFYIINGKIWLLKDVDGGRLMLNVHTVASSITKAYSYASYGLLRSWYKRNFVLGSLP